LVSLTAEEGKKADIVFNQLESYLKTYLAKSEPEVEIKDEDDPEIDF
jgi:hypothetical protein